MSDFNKFIYAASSAVAPEHISVAKCRVLDRINSSRVYVELENGDTGFVDSDLIFDTEEKAEKARQDAVIDIFHSLKICWNCLRSDRYAPDIDCSISRKCDGMYSSCEDFVPEEEND
mgnify:CR=1 FL=1